MCEPPDSLPQGLNRFLHFRWRQVTWGFTTPKALTDQAVEDNDQALRIQDGSHDALRDLAEALVRCSSKSSFGTLNCAPQFVARILEATYRRLLASHSMQAHIMRECAMLNDFMVGSAAKTAN